MSLTPCARAAEASRAAEGWRGLRGGCYKCANTREEIAMPDIKVDDGCSIHVEVEGPERAPVLMLSNSLGTDLHMWDEQVGPLTQHFRLVRYDRRGHGKSDVPRGPYSMARLGRDVVGVIDGLGIAKIKWG